MPLILGAGTGGNRIIINLQQQDRRDEHNLFTVVSACVCVCARVRVCGECGAAMHNLQYIKTSHPAVTSIVNSFKTERALDTIGIHA